MECCLCLGQDFFIYMEAVRSEMVEKTRESFNGFQQETLFTNISMFGWVLFYSDMTIPVAADFQKIVMETKCWLQSIVRLNNIG